MMTYTTPTGAHGYIARKHLESMVCRAIQAHHERMEIAWAIKLGIIKSEPPQHGDAGAAGINSCVEQKQSDCNLRPDGR